MVWVESPTNPLLKLVDLAAIAETARRRNLISVCDNTFCSPWVQRPLDHGFDIVMHSTTKYLNGHSDVVGGVAVVAGGRDAIRDKLAFLQNAVGSIAGPFQRSTEERRAGNEWVSEGYHRWSACSKKK